MNGLIQGKWSDRRAGFRVEATFTVLSTVTRHIENHEGQPLAEPEKAVQYVHPPAWALDNPAALRMALISAAELMYLLQLQAILRCSPLATPEVLERYKAVIASGDNHYVRATGVTWTKP